MKKFLLVFITIMSCYVAIGQSNKASNSLADFKKIINGKWILETYLDKLKKTMSPIKAQTAGYDLTQLFVNIEDANNKSIYADGWSLHEGGMGITIYFTAGLAKNTFKTDFNEPQKPNIAFTDIGYIINGKDSFLVLYHYNKAKKLLQTTKFKKYTTPATIDSEKFLDYVVNKTLFTGNYIGKDNSGNNVNISFSNEGGISGLKEFTKYEASTFILQTQKGNYYDKMYLSLNDNAPSLYSFKIEGAKLLLYELNENTQEQMILGPLKYTLVKKYTKSSF